jgi:hypothetical protein
MAVDFMKNLFQLSGMSSTRLFSIHITGFLSLSLGPRPCTLVLLQPHAHKKAVTVRDDVIPSLEPHHRPLHLRTSLHLPPRLHPRARLPCNHHQLRSAASVLLSSSCPLSPISSSTTRFFCCSQRRRVCNMSSHLPVSPSRGSHVYLLLDILQFVDSGSILADIFHSLRWLPLLLPSPQLQPTYLRRRFGCMEGYVSTVGFVYHRLLTILFLIHFCSHKQRPVF